MTKANSFTEIARVCWPCYRKRWFHLTQNDVQKKETGRPQVRLISENGKKSTGENTSPSFRIIS